MFLPLTPMAEDGVTDTEIKLGMVNVQSGPACALGVGMRDAIEKIGSATMALNPKLRTDASDFSNTQAEIMHAVHKSLSDDLAYRRECDVYF